MGDGTALRGAAAVSSLPLLVSEPENLSAFRFVRYRGDNMAPTIKRLQLVGISPIYAFHGNGLYAFEQMSGAELTIYRAQWDCGAIVLTSDSEHYDRDHRVTPAQFCINVCALVFATVNILNAFPMLPVSERPAAVW